MPKTKIASPARSHGSVTKTRRNKPRVSRSVGSPGPSTASGRLTTVIDQFTNMDSFAFSPLNSRLSVLTDKTDIEETHRKSWWKNLNENSGNIMEALGNEVIDSNNAFEKLVEIDVISQEKNNFDFELSDSSIDDSVKSIVLPQRKLFNQNENALKQKFGQIVGVRENLTKHHNNSTIQHDKTIIAGTKNFFQHTKKPKQVFPAALLNISHNKTVDKTKENVSISAAESKVATRNIFAGRANNKNKNIFANFILTESDDEVLDIQPKIFGFQKQTEMQPLIWQDQNSSDEFEDEVEQVQSENNKENLSKHIDQCNERDNNMDLENIDAEVRNESQSKVVDDSHQQTCEAYETNGDTNEKNINHNEDKDNNSGNDINQNNKDMDIVHKIQEEIHNIDDQNLENHGLNGENRVTEIFTNQKLNIEKSCNNCSNVEIEMNENNKSDKNTKGEQEKEMNNDNKQSKEIEQSQEETEVVVQNWKKDNKLDKSEIIDKVNNENESRTEKHISQELNPKQVVLNQYQADNVEDIQATAKELKECGNQNIDNVGNKNRDKETFNQSHKIDDKLKDACFKEDVNKEKPDEVNNKLNEVSESELADSKIHQHGDHSEVEMENKDNKNNSKENVSQQQHNNVHDKLDESQSKSDDDEVSQSNELEKTDTDSNELENTDSNESNDSSNVNLSQGQEEVEVNESQSKDDEVDATEEMEYESEESENEDDERSEHESVESEDTVKSDSHRNDSEADKSQGIESNESKSRVDISQDIDNEQDEDSMHVDVVLEEKQKETQEEMEVDENGEKITNDSQGEDIVEVSSNMTHKTINSNQNNMPETVLDGKISQQESFKAKERNESFRKTKSIYKDLNIRPSLAPARESIGLADGTSGSSVEGSGWDSHRTTRKTLRRTFGRDFTPRKSLRALVMEKSAKLKEDLETLHSETVMLPQANSTEYPDYSHHEDDTPIESDHEESRSARLAALDIKLQQIREKNLEKKSKIEEETKNFYKTQSTQNTPSLFKIPSRPPPRKITATNKPKKQATANIFGVLPPEVIEDMKYKPPKRFKPSNASWITKRLYKFFENKLEQKYDYRARVRAEKLVETIYHFTKDLRRQKVASTDSVKILKHEFARLNIVKTHFEFYDFFQEFMPREVRVKVVPDLVNKIALPRHGIFSDIL